VLAARDTQVGGPPTGTAETRTEVATPGAAAAPPVEATHPELRSAVERDRHAAVERVIELGRWLVLIFAAASANVPTPSAHAGRVNLILGAWALFNLALTVSLVTRHLPGPRIQYAMCALDMTVATALVYLDGGASSAFGLTFYAVVIAGSLRFGLWGSLLCASVVATLYLGASIAAAGAVTAATVDQFGSHLLLFLLIAVTSTMVTRELVGARARQLEHTLRLEHAAVYELREVDRVKTEFIMLASHELRTPLAKVKAWIALMQDAGDRLPPEAQREGVEVLRSETEHLARLTDNLLCIAQLEAGEIRLKTAPVTLGPLFEQVAGLFSDSQERGRVVWSDGGDQRVVLADSDRLVLVLACLVDNGLKFSPPGEPVRIASQRDGQMMRIEVNDRGRRIPAEQAERIFASFYQVEAPLQRQRGGCGVGLYLSRQLVERMGGRIWLSTEPGSRGNTFAFTLPIDPSG
jgi:signal transduction histidine kinase